MYFPPCKAVNKKKSLLPVKASRLPYIRMNGINKNFFVHDTFNIPGFAHTIPVLHPVVIAAQDR